MKTNNDNDDIKQHYVSAKELLHETDVSQFYGNGYSKEIIDGIFAIVSSTKIDKQVVGVMLKIGYECNSILRNNIVDATKFLDEAVQTGICNQHVVLMIERLYCILNGIHAIPKCKVCGKPLKNFKIDRSNICHYDCCSVKCKGNDPDNIDKRVKSYLSRPLEAKLKTKMQTQATIEQRFGDKCFMKIEYFKQKTFEYIKANGGECNVSQIKEVRAKVDKTNEDTYGNRCNLANKDQIELKRQTYITHFGVDHPMKNADFKKHFLEEFEAKHGCRCAFQLQESKDKLYISKDTKKRKIIQENEFVIPLFDLDAETRLLRNNKQYWWQCLKCGHAFAAQIIGYDRNEWPDNGLSILCYEKP